MAALARCRPLLLTVGISLEFPDGDLMFDEVDEGTAIFKCDPNPPVSETERFLSLSETPKDHYLQLVGEASRGIRGEFQVEREMPASISANK